MPPTILITGCSSGIGREAALLFHQKGWNVSATMRSPQKETELKQLERVEVLQLDVTDMASIESTVTDTVEAFGGLDAVVNNAGYGIFGPFEAVTREQIQRLFHTNLFGLFDVTRSVLPHLHRSKNAVLINISSMAGLYSLPLISLYGSTKFAVEGFTECLFYELEPLGIRVKLIEPGNVETNFVWDPASLEEVAQKEQFYYRKNVEAVLGFWENPSKKNARASTREVAETIYEAATDRTGKIRHIVGRDAQELWNDRARLGDQRYAENLLREVFGEQSST
jgi:NAD(P)-dependent dehydrogenase (short-subunit alcohol dehydrogenase family)